jgi:hypothetical protein
MESFDMRLRSLLLTGATALVAMTSLAWQTPATALDGEFAPGGLLLAQAAPAAPPAPGAGPDRPDRHMRHMRGMRDFSPKAMCEDKIARRIGDRAYLKARLDLKAEQMALWTTFEKAADEASAKEKARCASLPAEMTERPSFIDGLSMREAWLKARLATIEAVKPSLTAFYASLTTEQKALFDRSAAGHRHHHRRH